VHATFDSVTADTCLAMN